MPPASPSIATSPPSTPTPFAPTLAPAENQIANDGQVWTLKSVDFPAYVSALGGVYRPPNRYDPLLTYVFLRMNFTCTTGESLISLYAGADLGLSFVHKPYGYNDLSIGDLQGHQYLATLIGDCWLAAPIPRTRSHDSHFVLNFKDLPPFRFAVQPAAQESQEKICFISDRDGTSEVFTANPDGSDPQRLTADFSQASDPAWSPDHNYIAYATQKYGSSDLVVIDANGVRVGLLAQTPYAEGGPVWSPDGRQIAFHTNRDGRWEIYVVPWNGGEAVNLTQDAYDEMYPSWSADGKSIAFQTNRNDNWDIYLMDADGSNVHPMIKDAADDILPSWPPSGDELVFWSRRGGIWRLYKLGAAGAIPLTTYENPGSAPSRAAWSPDGQKILLALMRERFLQLYTIKLDGSEPTRLTNAAADSSMPGWAPSASGE